MNYNVDKKGYYGDFGGAFIPEMLYPNITELRENYLKISASSEFKKEFDFLLRSYVGRPTPLYFAKRLSKKYNTKILEDDVKSMDCYSNDEILSGKTRIMFIYESF